MSNLETWFWSILLIGALPALAVAGALFVRRAVGPEVLERHNEVAGFIYAVIGVVYAVLLGFTAIIVWEQFRHAQERVEREANELADLYRDAQVFPPEVRKTMEARVRAYARVVVEKEWPAMAQRDSSPEAWEAYNQLWRTYHEFRPRDDHQRIWYTESLQRLNALGDHRRDRLLSMGSGVPGVIWAVLLAAGAVTIGFSFFFGTRSAWSQGLMVAGLSFTIGVVLLSILALERPFAGMTRIQPEAFRQLEEILEVWSRPGAGRSR
ncbi:MAG: DUF4239 domain-containing protein [Burkholderiales bacterium]